MEIGSRSSLIDVAFAVCTALHRVGTIAVLTGGSGATFYAEAAYQSNDADFVIMLSANREGAAAELAALGYADTGGTYVHLTNVFTLEFPPGPLGIGSDAITSYETVRRGGQTLFVLSRTDSVRDRLAAFYHWADRSALNAAVAVALSGQIDLPAIERWSEREQNGDKFREFVRRFRPGAL